jgi:hypothetical protein
MNFFYRNLLAFCFLLLSLPILSIAQTLATAKPLVHKGELIVWLQPDADIAEVVRQTAVYQSCAKQCLVKHLNIWLLGFDEQLLAADQMLNRLNRMPQVSIAQLNHQFEPRGTYPNEFNGGAGPANWQLERADVPEAWDITTGGITTTGEQLVVAIVDMLFDPNDPDFDLWRNTDEIPNNGIDDDNNNYIDDYEGWSFQNNSDNIPDNPGHGYAMIRTAAAKGNNNMDISGLGWNIKAMQLDVDYSEAQAIAAYGYCHKTRKDYNESNGSEGAFIVSVNTAFGPAAAGSAHPIWCAMYDTLGTVGILSPGAVTNSAWNVDVQPDMPADCSSPYTIITHSEMEDYTQHGGTSPTRIDIAAPSTTTSESSAFTSGAVALLWSAACPNMIAAYKENPGTMALAMKEILLDNADVLGAFWAKNVANGRMNLHSAMQAVLNSSYCSSVSLDASIDAGINNTTTTNIPTCTPTLAQQLTLTNYGTNNLTTATIQYQLNGGALQNMSWTGNLGYFQSANLTLPTLTLATGTNTLVVTITNINGSTDENTTNNSITFTYQLVPPQFGPLIETFSLGTFPPNGWYTQNPDNSETWSRVAWISSYGGYTGTAYVNNFDYNAPGQRDYLVSPYFAVNADATAARIVFDVAYAFYGNYTDSLAVSVSADCGQTWERVYYKGGANLATNTAPMGEFEKFVPDANEWRTDTIWVSNLIGEENVQLRFENINNWGNSLYIDHVRFSAHCPIAMTGTANACITGNYTYSVVPVSGATYQWAIVGNGTIVSGQGTPQITVHWNTPGLGEVRIERTTP